jgi:uncharacterized protein
MTIVFDRIRISRSSPRIEVGSQFVQLELVAMAFLWAILLIVAILAAWCTNVAGLPGNWLILAIVVLYWMLRPLGAVASLNTIAVASIAALAALGELLEVLMGSAGVANAGGGRRSAIYAILGSVIGGCAGLIVGVPLPVFGPIAGSLFFGSLGAMAGAMLSERSSGKSWPRALQIGQAAFLGRALGTPAKMAVGLVMIFVIILGLLF